MTVKPVRKGDRIRLDCKGRGCSSRRRRSRSKNARKRSLLRYLKGAKLRNGAVVQLRITRPSTIGRVGTWQIRAPKIPKVTRNLRGAWREEAEPLPAALNDLRAAPRARPAR